VPSDAVTKIEDAIDRGTITGLTKDEVVISGRLSSKGQMGVAPGVPVGMRAVTIKTQSAATVVGGHLLPGNHVDVLLTLKNSALGILNANPDETGGGSTTTLLQNVEVLAVGTDRDPAPDGKTDPAKMATVTLIVTPDQATKLQLGQELGTLHLTLRNPKDT